MSAADDQAEYFYINPWISTQLFWLIQPNSYDDYADYGTANFWRKSIYLGFYTPDSMFYILGSSLSYQNSFEKLAIKFIATPSADNSFFIQGPSESFVVTSKDEPLHQISLDQCGGSTSCADEFFIRDFYTKKPCSFDDLKYS